MQNVWVANVKCTLKYIFLDGSLNLMWMAISWYLASVGQQVSIDKHCSLKFKLLAFLQQLFQLQNFIFLVMYTAKSTLCS